MPRAEAVQQRVAGRAGERGRMTVRDRAERLRQVAPAILQTAIGAGVAWLVARHVIGHPRPFFAPISAIIALGVVLDQRTRRAVEIVLGVAFGVLVADGIVLVLGTGAAQIALVVTLAMAGAVVLGGRRLIITQAATSAVLVTTLGVPGSFNFARPIDAVVGGATALTIHPLVLPLDPRRIVRRRLDPLLGALSGAIDRVAAAVAARDAGAIEDAQQSARQIDDPMGRHPEAVRV